MIRRKLLKNKLKDLFDAGKYNAMESTGDLMTEDIIRMLENKDYKFKV